MSSLNRSCLEGELFLLHNTSCLKNSQVIFISIRKRNYRRTTILPFSIGSVSPGEGQKGEHSTGLGMNILKRIIGLHGGSVWVESDGNKDTSIFFGIQKDRGKAALTEQPR